MRTSFLPVAALVVAMGSTGCGQSASSNGSHQADTNSGATNLSDQSCEIVLREAGESEINGGETYTDPGGQAWEVYRGDIDVDTTQLASGATVNVWYQNTNTTFPAVTVQAMPSSDPTAGLQSLGGGAQPPAGYTRFAFATTTNTEEAGDGEQPSLQLIPYLQFPDGHRLYDHNRTTGNYTLNAQYYFEVKDDFSVCPAPLAPSDAGDMVAMPGPDAGDDSSADAGPDVDEADAGADGS